MEINSSNLYNKDILKTNKFENLNSSSLEKVEDKELREVSNNFEAFFINQILEKIYLLLKFILNLKEKAKYFIII